MADQNQNKTAWVIGASKGLGAEISKQLASQNYKLFLSARNESDLNAFTKVIDCSHPIPLDVSNLAETHNKTSSLLKLNNHSLPNLIIFNAAVYTAMGLDQFDAAKIKQMIDVNYLGFVNLIDAIRDQLIAENKEIKIVVISSPSAWVGLPNGLGYGASKAALNNLCESLQTELPKNIKIKLIHPGFIKTRLTDQNDFKMPQIMDVELAAKKCLKAIEKSRFSSAFPYPFVGLIKLLCKLPYWLYFKLIKK